MDYFLFGKFVAGSRVGVVDVVEDLSHLVRYQYHNLSLLKVLTLESVSLQIGMPQQKRHEVV